MCGCGCGCEIQIVIVQVVVSRRLDSLDSEAKANAARTNFGKNESNRRLDYSTHVSHVFAIARFIKANLLLTVY